MKTMNFNRLVFSFFILSTAISYGQNAKSPAPDTLKNPLNKAAFHKNIMQDINFMVLGDNNAKQGFAYEYDEKKTELSLSGALISKKYFLATVDGSFSVDEGAFIFDNKDGGSKKGSLSLNLFAPAWFGNGKLYPAVKDNVDSGKANRARYLNYITQKELTKKVADTLKILNTIFKDLNLPQSSLQKGWFGLFGGKLETNNIMKTVNWFPDYVKKPLVETDKKELLKTLEKYYKNPDRDAKYDDYESLLAAVKNANQTPLVIKGRGSETLTISVPEGLDLEKLFKDYDKILTRAENIEEEVNDKQIKIFKDIWSIEYNTYFGLSTYYERESIDIYNSDIAIQTFSDRFADTKGDLYGLKLSFNHVATTKLGAFLMFRALADFGRASNFTDFDKKDFVYNTNPEVIGSGTILEEKKKTGYFTKDGAPYSYGFLQKYSTELYISSKVLGAYAKLGYSKNEALVKKETLPFETGIMINVKSEKKNVVSIIFFVAREDLKVHPELDTNFGLKVGLPINIKKSDKDKVDEKS
jgi:hypothetical protein